MMDSDPVDRLTYGGSLSAPYRPTRRDNALAFGLSLIAAAGCAGLFLMSHLR